MTQDRMLERGEATQIVMRAAARPVKDWTDDELQAGLAFATFECHFIVSSETDNLPDAILEEALVSIARFMRDVDAEIVRRGNKRVSEEGMARGVHEPRRRSRPGEALR